MSKFITSFLSRDNHLSMNLYFLHGLLGSQGDFLKYMIKLKNFFNIHLVSLPGHTRSQFNFSEANNLFNWRDDFLSNIIDINKQNIFITHSISSILFDSHFLKTVGAHNHKHYLISPLIFSDYSIILSNYPSTKTRVSELLSKTRMSIGQKKFNQELQPGFVEFYADSIDLFLQKKENKSYTRQDYRIIFGGNDELFSPSVKPDLYISDANHNVHVTNALDIADYLLTELKYET